MPRTKKGGQLLPTTEEKLMNRFPFETYIKKMPTEEEVLTFMKLKNITDDFNEIKAFFKLLFGKDIATSKPIHFVEFVRKFKPTDITNRVFEDLLSKHLLDELPLDTILSMLKKDTPLSASNIFKFISLDWMYPYYEYIDTDVIVKMLNDKNIPHSTLFDILQLELSQLIHFNQLTLSPEVLQDIRARIRKKYQEEGYYASGDQGLESFVSTLGDTVVIAALCHGEPISIKRLDVNLTRVMDSLWGICAFRTQFMQLDRYKKFCKEKVDVNEFVIKSQPEFTPPVVDRHYFETRREAMRGRTTQKIDSFNRGDEMIHKKFTEKANGSYEDFLNLLLLKNIDGECYNLFSIKDTWTMEEILDLLKGKNILFFDYSCSLITGQFTTEQLARAGGKNKTKKHKKKIR